MHRRTLAAVLAPMVLGLVAAQPDMSNLRQSVQDLFGITDALRADLDAIGGREVVFAFTPPDLSPFKSVVVDCPEGKVSIGGGGRITFVPGSGSTGQAIANSWPSSETSWSVSAVAPNPPQDSWQLIGYAVCASL